MLTLKNRPTKKSKTLKTNLAKQYNYFSKTEFYPDKYVESLFKSRGNWNRIETFSELQNTNKTIHFLFINGKYLLQKMHYGAPAILHNLIDNSRDLVLKHNLMTYLGSHSKGKKYILDSYNINAQNVMLGKEHLYKFKKLFISNSLQNDKGKECQNMFILKPVSGFGGANIYMVKSYKELNMYVNKIIKKWSHKWSIKNNFYKEWVLQKYLSEPLLFKNPLDNLDYKFHIRHYFIFRQDNGKSFYLKRGLIATGLKPYKCDDWNNKDIHDTHFHGRDGEKFPADLKLTHQQLQYINKQIYELYSIIDKYLKKHAGCYDEYKHCFQLFGADLMITRNYEVKILELNNSPGLADEADDKVLDEYKSVIENIMSFIVDEYFPPANKPKNTYAEDVVLLD